MSTHPVPDSEALGGPAYRIETPRLVIRCWNPSDAPLLATAVVESLDHLRPWMPWIRQEPMSHHDRVTLMRRFRAQFDRDEDYTYGILNPSESAVLGGSRLHTRVRPNAREIGYWIHVNHVGQGLATETAGALCRVAFEVDGVERVEIHCDPRNQASAAVAHKLGFAYEGTLRRRLLDADGSWRDTMVWSLLASEYEVSPIRGREVRAYDALGQELLRSDP